MTANAIIQPPEMLGIGTRAYVTGAAGAAATPGVQVVAFTGTSAASTYGVNAIEVALFADQNCFVVIGNAAGDAPTATATTGIPIVANAPPFHVRVPAAAAKIAVIRATANGNLYVIPVA